MAPEKKKLKKKKKVTKYRHAASFHIKNTIMFTVLMGMLLLVCVVVFIPAYVTYKDVKDAQIELPSKAISNLRAIEPLKNLQDLNKNSIMNIYDDRYPSNQTKIPFLYNENLENLISQLDKSVFSNKIKLIDIFIINPGLALEQGRLEASSNKISNIDKIMDREGVAYKYSDNILKKQDNSDLRQRTIYRIQSVPIKERNDEVKYDIFLVFNPIEGAENDYLGKIIKFEKGFFPVILLLSLLFVFLFARSISKPLVDMEKTVSKIAEGDLSGRLEFTKYDEINQLVQSYNVMANALQRLYSTLEKQVQDRTQELKSAYAELQSTQAMMVHSEKMKSLGELVAGIMHEINNPINFIYGNMTHLNNYSQDLIQIIDEYTKYNESLKPGEKQSIENLKQELDYEFLKSDLPDLIKSCKEGADRAKNIIQDLKSFSRMEEVAITDVDLEKEIDTVLNILHNKIKNKADVHKEYIESIPTIEAFGGQLNQVFMNILDNAVGAIKEHGDIWIRINKDKEQKNLVIEIEDNGIGMDKETAEKVFNPFFTTKPVGQGTGLGMSITYKIIKNHQGDIRVESTPNVGTKFIVTLPINIDRDLLKAGVDNGEQNG